MREMGEVRRDRRLCVRPFGRLKNVRCQIIGQAREALSPANRWIAYASDESGRSEIYVRAFSQEGTGSERKWLVSGNGGYWPKWRRDGKELLYLDADRGIVGVQVAAGASFQHATPQPLFAIGNSHPGCSESFGGTTVQRYADRMLLGQYAPAGLLVDKNSKIVEFRGAVGPYLGPAAGEADLDLLKMIP